MNKKKIALVAGIILITVVLRLLFAQLQWFHLVPVAALGLFSGSILKNKVWAYVIPFGALFITDIFFEFFTSTPGFYSFAQLFTYGGLLLVTLLGTRLNPSKGLSVLGYTIGGSLIFFIVSNFGVWTEGLLYPMTLGGLTECYAMAIPFYKSEFATKLFINAFGADLMFSIIAFALHNFSFERKGEMQTAKLISHK